MELMIALVTVALIGLVLYTVYTTPASTGCLSEDARRAKAAAAAVAQRKAEAAAKAPAAAVGTEGVERFLAPKAGAMPAAPKEEAKAAEPPKAAVAAAPAEAPPAPAKPQAAAPAPAKTPSAPAPAKAPAAAAPAAPAPSDITLRNPATGEKASVPANYRFAKKWVKEALVKEGLLDKIYKNNELDDAASKKVKAALEQFKTLAKYHA